MDRVRKNKVALITFLSPAVILFVGIIIIPMICSGYYSLLDWDGITEGIYVGIENYRSIFSDTIFRKSVLHMLILAMCAVCIQLPLALLLALILASKVKGERFFVTVFFIPVMMSTVVIGQLWLKIYNPQYGLLNFLLKAIGLEEWCRGWLGSQETVLAAVFVPMIWQYVGYHMLLLYAGIKSENQELTEAARIDGANSKQIAVYLTIPLLKPVLRVCTIFAITGAFKSFDLIYVLTNGGPAHASEVPSTLMFTDIFMKNQYGVGSAIAMFIIFICFFSALVIKRLFGTEEY